MYIIVQTYQIRMIRTNLSFYRDNIRTKYTMDVFYNSCKRIKFFNFRKNNVSFVSSRSNLDLM